MYPSVRTRGSRSETKKHKILWLLSIFQSSTYWCEIYHLHKGKVSKCFPERAHYKERDQPLSDIAGGSTSQLEPEKWQNCEEKILRRGGEGGQDLGRGDGNHIPHPDHTLHPLRELLDDLDAVESLAKKTTNQWMSDTDDQNFTWWECLWTWGWCPSQSDGMQIRCWKQYFWLFHSAHATVLQQSIK